MELLDKKLKEYAAEISVPDEVKPSAVKAAIEQSGFVTAGMFLKRLKEMKISGSEFLELLGNSKIGNMEFRRIEENPHLKFDELLQILDNSALDSDDYRVMLSVAAQHARQQEERKMREQETLRRMEQEKKQAQIDELEEQRRIKAEEKIALEQRKLDAAQAIMDRVLAQAEQQETARSVDAGNTDADSDGQTRKEDNALPVQENVQENVQDSDEDNACNGYPEEAQTDTAKPERDAGAELNKDTDDTSALDETDDAEEASEDFDVLSQDDEEISSSAEDIGNAISGLLDERETEQSACRRSKKGLIAAFTAAAVVLAAGCTLKALKYFEILPEYTYKMPDIINQEITDFTSLLEEAKAADGKVSYELPESLVNALEYRAKLSFNAAGSNTIAAISEDKGNFTVCGAKIEKGKISDTFFVPTGLYDVSVKYADGKYIVTGTDDTDTIVRVYDEDGIVNGEPLYEYSQSGEYYDCLTDGERIYTITTQSFSLNEARADNLKSFVPIFTHKETTTAVPLGSIVLPDTVNKLNYCTVSAVSYDGADATVKSVLMGDASGIALSDSGLYTCDNTRINDEYSAKFVRVAFDKDMTVYTAQIDKAVNPSTLCVYDGMAAAFGVNKSEEAAVNSNCVVVCKPDMNGVSCLEGVADGKKIASVSCTGGVMTLTTDEEKPFSYNIRLEDMSSTDEIPYSDMRTQISDKYSADAVIAADKDGNRTGVTLTVYGEDGQAVANVTAQASSQLAGQWNEYLTSPAADGGELSFCNMGDSIIIGLPVVYFDGISQVSEYRFYSFKDNKLKQLGLISLYDVSYNTLFCRIVGGENPYIITMWDNRIITADTSKIKIISDTVAKPKSEQQ